MKACLRATQRLTHSVSFPHVEISPGVPSQAVNNLPGSLCSSTTSRDTDSVLEKKTLKFQSNILPLW